MSMSSSSGSVGADLGIRFADIKIGEHFILNGFRLKKVGPGTAVVKEAPLGKEVHKGAVKLFPEHYKL